MKPSTPVSQPPEVVPRLPAIDERLSIPEAGEEDSYGNRISWEAMTGDRAIPSLS